MRDSLSADLNTSSWDIDQILYQNSKQSSFITDRSEILNSMKKMDDAPRDQEKPSNVPLLDFQKLPNINVEPKNKAKSSTLLIAKDDGTPQSTKDLPKPESELHNYPDPPIEIVHSKAKQKINLGKYINPKKELDEKNMDEDPSMSDVDEDSICSCSYCVEEDKAHSDPYTDRQSYSVKEDEEGHA